MVVRNRAPKPVQTPAQARRSAQRKLARDLKQGKPILPKEITRKAKEVVNKRSELVNRIADYKKQTFGDKESFNARRSRQAVERDRQGNPRSIAELRQAAEDLDNGEVPEDESILYYH